MDNLLKIDVGIVGLDEEVYKNIAEIEKEIPIALNAVGSEMIESLNRHLDEDFYNEYNPVAYRRRYTEGLKNQKNIDAQVYGTKTLSFTYTPSGEPVGKLADSWNWSEDLENWLKSVHKTGETPFFSPTRSGDELIVWAQKAHDIGKHKIPARPFWNHFVEEQKESKIIDTFIGAFSNDYRPAKEGGEMDIQFDGQESMLEAGNEQLKMKINE